MVVYIAGKMRGLQDLGRAKFNEAARDIKGLGHIALSPAVLPTGMDDNSYLPICTAMIDAADAVYMLDNWTDSVGAKVEHSYAVAQGKYIIYENNCELGRDGSFTASAVAALGTDES